MSDDFGYSSDDLPDSGNYPDKTTEPWWNDQDKAGGLAATIVLLAIAILVLGGSIKLVTMMF